MAITVLASESHSNVRVLLGATLTAMMQNREDARVALTINNPTTLNATYVMACDGAYSFVRRQLGTAFEDLDFDEWRVVVDTWLKNPDAAGTLFPQPVLRT